MPHLGKLERTKGNAFDGASKISRMERYQHGTEIRSFRPEYANNTLNFKMIVTKSPQSQKPG